MPSGNGFRIAYEENPRNELTPAGTPTTGPNRVSTVTRDFPVTAARINANPALLSRADEARNFPAATPGLSDSFAPDGALAERAYIDDLIFLFPLAGYTGTFTAGGATTSDVTQTTATGVNALNSATVNVGDTSWAPSAGTFMLAGAAVTYTGKTATSFTGCGTHAATVGGEAIAGNVPTGASKWQFVRRTGITPQTATVTALYANEGFFLQGRGFAITDYTLNAAGEFGSTWMGLFVGNIADPSITPTLISPSIPPVRRADLSVTWISGGATASDFSISDTTGLQVTYDMGANGTYFPQTIEVADALPALTGSITKRQLNANDWAALIAASTFSARAKWQQTVVIGATTYKYTMFCEMPSCYITGGTPDEMSAARRRGGAFNFQAGYDATAGYDVRWTLIGSVTSVSAYP